MVKLHIKKGEESHFLYETNVGVSVEDLIIQLVRLYNGRLKVDRLCQEIELLSSHGILLPPNMQGLTDEQIIDLKLKDEYADTCIPCGGHTDNPDPVGRRNGRAPNEKMKEVLHRTISEARAAISKNQVAAKVCMTEEIISDSLDKLRGAIMIVYPMNLPPYDPIRLEFEGQEDLTGSQASLAVLEESTAQLWWAGKELTRSKKLQDFIGRNEKTTIIAKLQKKGQGAPAREPVFSEDAKKEMMSYAYRRQEELKKLEADEEDSYLNAQWADPHELKRSFQGLRDIKWGSGLK
ncbi:PREDICTED: UPF0769 protein C21orf59 homolog [Amphimedon queenslandica]|uniref:Cilia- and flagella-associated protein 298 n=1 Tax=Amphimedon queenslandica TaxID=400682 RepID=A0A1X7U7D8_AMPQE|nr:PREDICTED: UPF0769 protein C21orf59 homolog [Amphimedon queenslandica]|eukprot:XP_003388750.1 PREDICTED: UPF0769 protein C21orf59 homolog [Amphimedon queenslandica]